MPKVRKEGPIIWSPKPRSSYTVKMSNGSVGGLGARSVFNDRPGLWNMFWLHSVRVDSILTWPKEEADAVPGYSVVINECEKSATFPYKSFTLEGLAEFMTAREWVNLITANDFHPMIRVFWDNQDDDSWLELVTDRISLSRQEYKQDGNVFAVNFS